MCIDNKHIALIKGGVHARNRMVASVSTRNVWGVIWRCHHATDTEAATDAVATWCPHTLLSPQSRFALLYHRLYTHRIVMGLEFALLFSGWRLLQPETFGAGASDLV